MEDIYLEVMHLYLVMEELETDMKAQLHLPYSKVLMCAESALLYS